MGINERKAELIERFEWIDDEMDRYEEIIQMGRALPPMDESLKVESNEVKGCQSKVWLVVGLQDGKINIMADSNTVITKGIVAILVYLWNGLTPEELLNEDTEILDQIGLRKHLSSQRNNGLTAMIATIKRISKNT